MGTFILDVDDLYEAERATRHGMFASFGYAALMAIGTAAELFRMRDILGVEGTGVAIGVMLAIMAALIILSLIAAYQFGRKGGFITGSILLSVFVLDTLYRVVTQFQGIMGYVILLAILLGLINGVRGAWALRNRDYTTTPESYAETFE